MTDPWSEIAEGWAELWGGFAEPAQRAVAQATGIGPGTAVLDVGCGSGEFLAYAHRLGARAAGADPAPGMVALARKTAPHAEVRTGDAEHLPWPDDSFDVVTAFNAIQFAEDPEAAITELRRVGRQVAIAGWAERARNDFTVIEDALEGEPRPDGGHRDSLEDLMRAAGLEVTGHGIVEVVWHARDDDTLVRGVLLGGDADADADATTVLEAARPYKTDSGGYRLVNAFRYAIGR
ncbi:class I SAM-dependent methyltransferase [Kibdelosporangium persicum]|uniref:Class I SAM-dependent methyltransferase n=1 Tax=Kibdelosporangium persicum TaxID=2698649 RepID=A0ABX2F2K2_9PSEU|nr:class I SAM-dependent methyltransferase [Kibdelosporangium persicum]NRN65448.1 Class I SAM-dependent methyltransferase [Kibdelosporangium persicum]